MHVTSDKGDIGVLSIAADLTKKGCDIFIPMSSTLPYDLLVGKNNKFYKVSVKYREEKNGVVDIEFKRAVISNSKKTKRRLENDEVDFFAIYCPTTDKCYYINFIEFEHLKCGIRLRINPTGNNQTKTVNLADNYTNIDFLGL